jgi:alpha-amylase
MLLGGGHNPAAYHEVAGRRVSHDEGLVADGIQRLNAGNEQLGIALETSLDEAATAWISPIESVSNSEGGFELVYQGSATVLVRPIRLRAGERAVFRVEQRVGVAAPSASGNEASSGS